MHFYRGSGSGAAAYFDEGHRGAEAYYTESVGSDVVDSDVVGSGASVATRTVVQIDTWSGGARVAPSVAAAPGELIRWVEGIDPATGEVKGVIRSGGVDRQPLRFVEVVINNPKSLSIVASQNPVVAEAVDAVLSRQGNEVAKYLSTVAVTRTGGRGAQVEVGGLTVETARVMHLSSREGDPHRHVHLMLNTRVKSPDGSWRGLHSAAIRQHIGAINELGSRVLVTDQGLREVLGQQGYTLGTDGEIDQARDAVALLSKRTALVAANRETAERQWREDHPNREPSQRVRNGWDQQGWAQGRKAKPYEREAPEQMTERVRAELAAAGFDFTLGARLALSWERGATALQAGQIQPVTVAEVDRDGVAEHAVAVLSGKKSAWSEADLTAQVEATVSATAVVGDDRAVTQLVEDCRARASELCRSVLDDETWTPTVMSRHLSSEAVIAADMALNLGLAGLVGDRNGHQLEDRQLEDRQIENRQIEDRQIEDRRIEDRQIEDRRIEDRQIEDRRIEGREKTDSDALPLGSVAEDLVSRAISAVAGGGGLDLGQAAAVVALCGERRLEVVIGPAGSGKTRMLSVANEVLVAQGRDLVVVSPTRKGAQVAGAEVGVPGVALSKLLYDHGFRWDAVGRWSRLATGELDPVTGRVHEGVLGLGGAKLAALSDRSVIVVDEAGLMTVEQANALIDVAAESGASIRLVGDPRQLGAVGRGGVMQSASRWSGGAVTLEAVHRFLRTEPDEVGLPVTVVDQDYAELSLLLRACADPEALAERLVERDAVVLHATRADAVAAIATEVASQGRAGALAVTVATNEEARVINEATRERRVTAGLVDDTVTATGMDGTRIGAGDRIVTRRNDTGAGVANREAWIVEAVTAEGTVVASPAEGSRTNTSSRRVHLEADYVFAYTQLGYATTDYGNQGVTTDRSITWVSDATTAGGLYVGATRGRYDNALHVVATHTDDAKAQLVAASARDRADRGLDVARSVAEADAVAVRPTAIAATTMKPNAPLVPAEHWARAAPPVEPAQHHAPDPATWLTEAELDAVASIIEADLDTQLRRLEPVAVMSDPLREGDDRADAAAARDARERAAHHSEQAARVTAGRDHLVETVTAEFLAARDDARVIADGPGLFARRAGRIEEASTRRAELIHRWPNTELPGAAWSNDSVRGSATRAAGRIIDADVGYHTDIAQHALDAATRYEQAVADRATTQQARRETNERRATERGKLLAKADRSRSLLDVERNNRDAVVETMTPEQVTAADQARKAYLVHQAEQIRQANQIQRDKAPRRPGPGERPTRQISSEERARQARAQRTSHDPHNERGRGMGM